MDASLISNPPYGTSLYLALATILATAIYYFMVIRQKGLPPGPTGVPVLGYWPFIKEDTSHTQFAELKKKYGDVFCFNVMGHLFVNLGSYKVIREAKIVQQDCFALRVPHFSLLHELFKGSFGFANGERWQVIRKFFVKNLQERGLSMKRDFTGLMYRNIDAMIADFERRAGESINLVEDLMKAISDIWFQSMFGDDMLEGNDLQTISDFFRPVSEYLTSFHCLPIGKVASNILLRFMPDFQKSLEAREDVIEVIRKIVVKRKATYKDGHIRDIVDLFIKERAEKQAAGDPTVQYYTDEALQISIMQMLGDGCTTVSPYIAVYFLSMALNPREQELVYEEVLDVVGAGRHPTTEDRSRLPYTNAFILEVLRTTNFFPYSPNLICTKDTKINGYKIPKGSIAFINMWCAHSDPKIYDEPEKFKPSRWLPKDKNMRPDLPILFGLGKRSCIGEIFIQIQVFLFLTSIVKHFKISIVGDVALGSDKMLLSGKIRFRFTPRNSELKTKS